MVSEGKALFLNHELTPTPFLLLEETLRESEPGVSWVLCHTIPWESHFALEKILADISSLTVRKIFQLNSTPHTNSTSSKTVKLNYKKYTLKGRLSMKAPK